MSSDSKKERKPKYTGDWYIMNKENDAPYITRPYKTKKIAEDEKRLLLRGFSEYNKWRERLYVGKIEETAR